MYCDVRVIYSANHFEFLRWPSIAAKNIKVRDNFKLKRRYANSQKLFYLKPKKRGELNAFEEEQDRQ